jgi:thiamine-phosphate pyrophosphorylase
MPPLLCYVTDRNALAEPSDLNEQIARVIGAGIDWIQIREKNLPTRELLAVTRTAVEASAASSGSHARIIVNDRLDVALAAKASGVHLRESSAPVAEVSAWRKEAASRNATMREFLIGASCHSLESARAAERDGADYVIFGPVFMTPSKAKFGAPQGIKQLVELSNAVKIPVLAVGGITAENARECFAAGAAGIAAIRMFSEAGDLAALVGRLRAAR